MDRGESIEKLAGSSSADKYGNVIAEYPSLRHRTHASSVLNSLVSKRTLGKIKIGNSYYFTTPVEAVLESRMRPGCL